MKGTWAFAMGVVLSAAVTACGSERPWGDVTVFDAADGATVTVAVGQTLAVGRHSAGDGGYSPWSLAAPPDPAVLRLVRTGNDRSRHANPGDYGRDIFVFEAVGAGTTQVVETTSRSWDPSSLMTFTLGVVVR